MTKQTEISLVYLQKKSFISETLLEERVGFEPTVV